MSRRLSRQRAECLETFMSSERVEFFLARAGEGKKERRMREKSFRVRRPRNVILCRTKFAGVQRITEGTHSAVSLARAEGVRSAAPARHSINQSRCIARRVSVGNEDGRILPHDPSTEITRMKYAHPSGISECPVGVSSARVGSQEGDDACRGTP